MASAQSASFSGIRSSMLRPSTCAIRTTITTDLNNKLNSLKTSPALSFVMEWFCATSNGRNFQPETESTSPELHPLIVQQAKIGWFQILNERFFNMCASIQYSYLLKNGFSENSTYTGFRWNVQVILVVWRYFQTIWDSRNQKIHGPNQDSTYLHTALLSKVRDVYDLRPWFNPVHYRGNI